MNDDPTTPNPQDEVDVDPGEPVDSLANFEHGASDDFLGRIRRSIQRRTTASQIATFSWDIPFVVFLEFWITLADHLFPKHARKDQGR